VRSREFRRLLSSATLRFYVRDAVSTVFRETRRAARRERDKGGEREREREREREGGRERGKENIRESCARGKGGGKEGGSGADSGGGSGGGRDCGGGVSVARRKNTFREGTSRLARREFRLNIAAVRSARRTARSSRRADSPFDDSARRKGARKGVRSGEKRGDRSRGDRSVSALSSCAAFNGGGHRASRASERPEDVSCVLRRGDVSRARVGTRRYAGASETA